MERLSRSGFDLTETITVHLDSDYDSALTRELLNGLGCSWQISQKDQFVPINHTHRWKVERTNSWDTRSHRSP